MSNSLYPQEYVSLLQASDNTDIAAKLISEGLLRAENRREKKVEKLVRMLLFTVWQLFLCSQMMFHRKNCM